MRTQFIVTSFVLCLMPQWAHAHLVSTRFGEFYNGLLHPVITLSHLVPWIAIGLLAGIQNKATGKRILILFPVCVLVGAVVAGNLSSSTLIDNFNLLSFAILGLLIIFAVRMPTPYFIFTVFLFGLSHGFGNGLPELSGKDQLLYLMGVTAAAYLVVTLLSGLSHWLIQSQQWGLVAVRAAGSWITAIGTIYLGFIFITPVTT